MRFLIIFVLLFSGFSAFAEDKISPTEITQERVQETGEGGRPTTWTQWLGSFHLIFLHFPIAIINMLALSEFLFYWLNRPIFDYSSRFLVIAAAIAAPPTALLGLIYSYFNSYQGLMETFLLLHMWLGFFTAIFAVITAFLREERGIGKFYYWSLFFLLLLVNSAGFFGGGMAWGPYHMNPPL